MDADEREAGGRMALRPRQAGLGGGGRGGGEQEEPGRESTHR